jgi:putative phosphoribosyl transferase
MIYRDRADAGRHLASLLERYRSEEPLILGLVRGGMAVAAEVARVLGAPLDVLVVRKVGVPGHEELAMGAVAKGTAWLNEPLIAELGIPRSVVERRIALETAEVDRREQLYREGRPPTVVRDRTVIVVDDGLATGATALAGIRVLRQLGARRVVFAAPVCSLEGRTRVAAEADDVVCFSTPAGFYAVSQAYESFPQLDDQAVHDHLEAAAATDSLRGEKP